MERIKGSLDGAGAEAEHGAQQLAPLSADGSDLNSPTAQSTRLTTASGWRVRRSGMSMFM